MTALRELLAVGRDHPQVELFERRRIAGGALQDGELRVDRHDRVVGALHVLEQWRRRCETIIGLPKRGHVLQQRRVLQIAGGDLVGRHVERLRGSRRSAMSNAVEKKSTPSSFAYACSSTYSSLAELQRLAVLAVGGAEAVLVVVRLVVHLARVERAVVALLQLHRVRAGQLRPRGTAPRAFSRLPWWLWPISAMT